ncbi:MAG: alanine--tRNA ligase, partial [Cytophagales bacterium CG18_big_fil_WC_8_21_14_2_50_42_9]
GDTGFLESELSQVRVLDTKKENDLIIHITHDLPQDVESPVFARVDTSRRNLIRKNHSATHLLHAALKQVLGSHVNQKGSLVSEKLLRFDFSHFTKVTADQLREIESIVNERIRQNIPLLEQRNVPLEEAKALGAMALFGEKYGNFVRVITFDKNFSVELCGGIHVPGTGEIGFFKITAESSVAAGVRRIEAVTAIGAEEYVQEQVSQLEEVKELVGQQGSLTKNIERLLEENNSLRKQLEQFELKQVTALKNALISKAQHIDNVNFISARVEVSNAEYLKKLAFDIRNAVPENLCLVLATEIEGKPQIAVMLSDNLVKEKNFNATALVKELAKEIKGGGGGQPFYATAGGKDVNGLDVVVSKAAGLITEMVNS